MKREAPGASVGVGEPARVHRFSHEAMATVFEVLCAHPDARYAAQAAHEAFALVDRLEQALSRFIPNSDVARAAALGAGQSTRVGSAAMECLGLARHLLDLTGGAFDVSLGTGLAGLELDPDTSTVHSPEGGVRLDLGGIGKGYAVDRVAELLEEWEISRALVHGGFSSVLALEPPPDGDGWTLTLRAPGAGGATVARRSVRQRALGASGVQKGDHVLDPRSGRPAPARAAWVAVPRGPEAGGNAAAVADALSTAFMLLPLAEVGAIVRRGAGTEAWILPDGAAGGSSAPGPVHLAGPPA